MRGITVRPTSDDDLEAVIEGANRFYAGFDLYPSQTPAGLAAFLGPTAVGAPHRQYRVAVRDDGTIVAGAAVTERFKLMTDQLEHIPRPLALLSRVAPLIPPDGVIRSIELSLAWHAPGRGAGRASPLGCDPLRVARPSDPRGRGGGPAEPPRSTCSTSAGR